ncbi:MAG TPA: GNAT family N-acetyltransferase [Opitutaceae bacterium]|nr:GNAT family N-acetyltransferase [Opitutaceae bacterium]
MPADIRSATVQDVPLILGLIRELAEYEKLSHQLAATEDALRSSLFPASGHPPAECALAFESGSPAGYALYFTTFSSFLAKPGLWLEDLYVKPALRHRGIGKALILHVARLANERGCGRMEWSVLDWNAPAIRFYDSLGAESLADWRICRLTGEALTRYR